VPSSYLELGVRIRVRARAVHVMIPAALPEIVLTTTWSVKGAKKARNARRLSARNSPEKPQIGGGGGTVERLLQYEYSISPINHQMV